jgi:hypothetical protein
MSRVNELDLPLKWANTYVASAGAALGTLDAFSKAHELPADAIRSFRAAAQQAGAEIPEGAEADTALRDMLLGIVAYVKWGNAGVYQVEARTDPAIVDAMTHFGKFSGKP